MTDHLEVEVHELAMRTEGTRTVYVGLCTFRGGGKETRQRVWCWASKWQDRHWPAPTLAEAARFVVRELVKQNARGLELHDFERMAPVLEFRLRGEEA